MAENELKIKVTTEGADQAATELEHLNDALDTNTEAVENNTSATEAAGTTLETHTDSVKKNNLAVIENLLKNQQLREAATGTAGAFIQFAGSIAQASQMTNENARNAAIAKAGWATFTQTLTAINPVIGGTVTAISSLAQSVMDLQAAEERTRLETAHTSDVFSRRLNIDLTETKAVVDDLVSSMELQRIAIQAQRDGLTLTSQQYARLAVVAQELSQRTGEDLVTSLQKVTHALATANANELEDYGINVGNASERTDVLAAAFRSLEQRVIPSTRTIAQNQEALIAFGEKTDRVTEAMANEERQAASLTGAERTRLLAVERSNEAVNAMMTAFDEMHTRWETSNADTTRGIEGLMAYRAAAEQTITSVAGLQGMHVPSLLGAQEGETPDQTNARLAEARQAARGAGGGTPQEEWKPEEALRRATDQANALNDILNPIFEQQNALQAAQLAMQMDSARIESERATAEVQRTNEMRQQTDQLNQQKDLITQQGLMQAQAQARREEDAKQQATMNMGLGTANSLMQMGASIAQTAHKNGKKAAKEQLKEWLKSFAISEALKGGTALAEGIGMTITNPPGAATKYSEAAYHFVLAAAAGGASAGIKGGGGSAAKGSSDTGGGVKPSGAGGGQDGGGQAPNITINIEGQALLTEGQIGREISNALNSYTARY